jgi:hypothetical protein
LILNAYPRKIRSMAKTGNRTDEMKKLEVQARKRQLQAFLRRRQSRSGNYHLALLFVFGIALAVFAGYVAYMDNFVYNRWTPVTAHVVSVAPYKARQWNGEEEDRYRITLSYPVNGAVRTASEDWSGTSKLPAGAAMPVMFDPNNPGDFRGNYDHFPLAGFSLALAACMMLPSGYFLFRRPRRRL